MILQCKIQVDHELTVILLSQPSKCWIIGVSHQVWIFGQEIFKDFVLLNGQLICIIQRSPSIVHTLYPVWIVSHLWLLFRETWGLCGAEVPRQSSQVEATI